MNHTDPTRNRYERGRSWTDELIGRRFGGFVLQELVRSGGQGLLFRADQPALGRAAMIKVLDARAHASDSATARFLREARLASMLDHPYAAHVYAADAEPDGVLWIAMELVRGMPLDELIRTRGPLPLARFVPFFERLCQVVQSAHEQGLVHRDIKPANVMVVARAGHLLPKLLDFGVAKLEGEHAAAFDDGLLGSPAYMAPEQWIDPDRADAATDQYQLAILGWEALIGRRPFHADSLPVLAGLHASARAPAVPRSLPAALDAVFARALAKRRSDRFESVLAFAVAMRAAAGVPRDCRCSPAVPAERVAGRGKRRRRAAGAVIAIAIAITFAILQLVGRTDAQAQYAHAEDQLAAGDHDHERSPLRLTFIGARCAELYRTGC